MYENQKKARRVLVLIAFALVSLLIAVVVSACGGSSVIRVHGTMETAVSILDGENASEAFPDISDGGQVTVVNSSGAVIGTGQLSETSSPVANPLASTETYSFTVSVPGGLARYGIQIGQNRGTVYYTAAQMASGPAVCLGDGC